MRFLFTCLAVLLASLLMAQTKEGIIIFETRADMHRRIPQDNQQARAMIPAVRITKNELLYSSTQSLYRPIEEEPDLTQNDGGGIVTIKLRGPGDNIYFYDFATKKITEQRELMGSDYLIEQPADSGRLSWKLIDGETKTILGHSCKKALAKSSRGNDMEAWYAEDMPIPSGPSGVHDLPGMILQLDINKGEFTTIAKEFQPLSSKNELKAPAKGKKVTEAEYAKIMKDAFGDQPGGIRIVTNDN
jgi:GLPGLI family protein